MVNEVKKAAEAKKEVPTVTIAERIDNSAVDSSMGYKGQLNQYENVKPKTGKPYAGDERISGVLQNKDGKQIQFSLTLNKYSHELKGYFVDI